MHNISQAYNEIINLMHASKHHKKNCVDSDCHVSLYLLKTTATGLLIHVPTSELEEAKKVIEQMDMI